MMIAVSIQDDLIFAFPMLNIYKPIMEKTEDYRDPVCLLDPLTYR